MATARVERRPVRYQSLEDVLVDAEHLAVEGFRTTGNWTFGQILKHLAMGGDACFDGFGDWRAPWWARTFVAPLLRKRFLYVAMPAGIRFPDTADRLLPPERVLVEEALEHLRRSIARFENEMPNQPHPFLGRLRSRDEYLALMYRHCELHMSYVHPG
jgi:hypothetical protein